MKITAGMVKELRDKTNAGMMDCKQALSECGCNLEESVDWLRQKGLMTARKREGRATKEGLIAAFISSDEKIGAMIELNCETDFVAKNESFQEMADDITTHILENPFEGTVEELLEQNYGQDKSKTLATIISGAVGTIGENMILRRYVSYQAGDNSMVHVYIHGGGRIGVILELEVEKISEEITDLAHNLTMHIAATNPVALSVEDIPKDLVTREKNLYEAQAAESGKPEKFWPKIIEGRLNKFFSEVTLLGQNYIRDDKFTVSEFLEESCKTLGSVKIKRFTRFQLGEELASENESE